MSDRGGVETGCVSTNGIYKFHNKGVVEAELPEEQSFFLRRLLAVLFRSSEVEAQAQLKRIWCTIDRIAC